MARAPRRALAPGRSGVLRARGVGPTSAAHANRVEPTLPFPPNRSGGPYRLLFRAQLGSGRRQRQTRLLLTDPHLFVVIDEAHHAPAKSYRDAIKVLEAAGSHKLLGLTATPTRTAEDERPELSRPFWQTGSPRGNRKRPDRQRAARTADSVDRPNEGGRRAEDDRRGLQTPRRLSRAFGRNARGNLGRDERRNLIVADH